MDAFIDTLIQLLIDWGYAGLFISALLAGSIIPFSSELVMLALVKVGLNPAICVLAATLGNTMGGMTCYYMYNPQIEMFARFKMKSSFHKTKRII